MGCNYYFVPKALNYNEIDNIRNEYKAKLDDLVNNYIIDINTKLNSYNIDKEIFSNHLLDIDDCDLYLANVNWPDIHICKISMGWKPLLQSNGHYSSIEDLVSFYELNKDKLRVEDEYRTEVDFYNLINMIKERYNDKSAKSHLNGFNQYFNYNHNYYNKDNKGFEWSTLDFS